MSEESNEQNNTQTETTKPPSIKKILEQIDSEQEKRKAAEAELKESKTFNETLLNTSPDEIYVYDIIKKIIIYSTNRSIRSTSNG